jgi:hypothetical protein
VCNNISRANTLAYFCHSISDEEKKFGLKHLKTFFFVTDARYNYLSLANFSG